jgi:hypothetical protein
MNYYVMRQIDMYYTPNPPKSENEAVISMKTNGPKKAHPNPEVSPRGQIS